MQKKTVTWMLLISALLGILLIGCQEADAEISAEAPDEPTSESPPAQPMMGSGRSMMGPGSGMMARHHATIPPAYGGVSNPIEPDQDSLSRGEELYSIHCLSCHGDEGQGDGPAGVGLDPVPAPIAYTGSMLGDDYLFWRISEGGALPPFTSAMPSWKSILAKEERWDVINYLRVMSGGQPSDKPFDAQEEAEKRSTMLAQALEQDLITEEEAVLFDDVHTKMDVLMAEFGSMDDSEGSGQDNIMSRLIDEGSITEEEAASFNDIHDRLLFAGLMH